MWKGEIHTIYCYFKVANKTNKEKQQSIRVDFFKLRNFYTLCVKGGGGKEGKVKIQRDLNDKFSFWKVTNKTKKDPTIKEFSKYMCWEKAKEASKNFGDEGKNLDDLSFIYCYFKLTME